MKSGKRKRVRERKQWIDEEKEADDDDGCKGGCPSSFSSAAAANPSGDSARQLSTDCRGLPLEKPRSKLNAERFLVRCPAPLNRAVLRYRFRIDKKTKRRKRGDKGKRTDIAFVVRMIYEAYF